MESQQNNPYASPQPLDIPTESAWVKHVRIVSVLLIAQGVIECCFGTLLLTRWTASVTSYIYITVLLAIGILKIVAGAKNFNYQTRELGVWALLSGFLSVCSFIGFPTAITLMIYGLIVYRNKSVVDRFATEDHHHRRN